MRWMQQSLKAVAAALIPIVMQMGIVGLVETTPREAATDFLDGLKTGDSRVMEKYMDNQYVNLLANATGDEAVLERMNKALFANSSYEIQEIAEKNDVAVAKVLIRSNDFSAVMTDYTAVSHNYVMENLYTDEIADKEALAAQCLELYVQQIEKAAAAETALETVVFIPMIDDGYHGWNIQMTDELMRAFLGNLELPVSR